MTSPKDLRSSMAVPVVLSLSWDVYPWFHVLNSLSKCVLCAWQAYRTGAVFTRFYFTIWLGLGPGSPHAFLEVGTYSIYKTYNLAHIFYSTFASRTRPLIDNFETTTTNDKVSRTSDFTFISIHDGTVSEQEQ